MKDITRRDFFKVLGVVIVGAALPAKALAKGEPKPQKPGWTNGKYLEFQQYHPVHAVLIDGSLRVDGDLYIKGHKIEIE